jgi:DUF1009 family protein
MRTQVPSTLAIIAGKGSYPLLLAQSARSQGVERLFAVAFRSETDPSIARFVDEVKWLPLGKLRAVLDALDGSGARHAVMAGQLTPTALFHVRLDAEALAVLKNLKERNAETIFGAVAARLAEIGIELMPAHAFMESNMAPPGQLGAAAPTEAQRSDIALGMKVAKASSELDVGQTVVVKEGIILAVEAFEGTNEAIKRAAHLGGPGIVVVKAAKTRHDMRFDIPVIGMRTMKLLRRLKASVLAVEVGRTILLDRDKLVREADAFGLCFMGVSAVVPEGKQV